MSDMKCPFCQQELDTGNYYVHCHNPHCNTTVEMEGTEEMWEVLIRTRKALEIAVDALKRLEKELYFNNAKQTGHIADSVMSIPSIALEQITALEQKE